MSNSRAERRRARKIIVKEQKLAAAQRARADSTQRPEPVIGHASIEYTVAERTRAIGVGGIGALDLLVQKLGLAGALNELDVLKRHLPYHESDHILTLVYNLLCGGTSIEDVRILRSDPTFLAALGVQRLPDPTTLGDFLRRFDEASVLLLQDVINDCRLLAWQQQPSTFFDEATLDIDGTLVPVGGNCKEGVGMSYKGDLSYHPLLISLAQTQEPLFLVNRPGNHTSSQGAASWVETAIGLVERAGFRKITLRGDTAFTQAPRLDEWDHRGVRFVLGLRITPSLENQLVELSEKEWKPLERPPKYQVQTQPRGRPDNVREQVIKKNGYLNLTLEQEEVVSFLYRPSSCRKTYRLVVVRKTIRQERGERLLLPEVRYFAYLTNDQEISPAEVVFEANQRCEQEKLIGELKNQVHAMRMPVTTSDGNWAYMVIAALAYSLKTWFALFLPSNGRWKAKRTAEKHDVLTMDFRRFLLSFVQIPAQIVRDAGQIGYRLLNHNRYTSVLLTFLQQMTAPLRS